MLHWEYYFRLTMQVLNLSDFFLPIEYRKRLSTWTAFILRIVRSKILRRWATDKKESKEFLIFSSQNSITSSLFLHFCLTSFPRSIKFFFNLSLLSLLESPLFIIVSIPIATFDKASFSFQSLPLLTLFQTISLLRVQLIYEFTIRNTRTEDETSKQYNIFCPRLFFILIKINHIFHFALTK